MPSEDGADSVGVYVNDTKIGTFITISLIVESGEVGLAGISLVEDELNAAQLVDTSNLSSSGRSTSIAAMSAGTVIDVVVIVASVAGIVVIIEKALEPSESKEAYTHTSTATPNV